MAAWEKWLLESPLVPTIVGGGGSTTGLWHYILTNQLFLVLAKQTLRLQAYTSGILESAYKAKYMS